MLRGVGEVRRVHDAVLGFFQSGRNRRTGGELVMAVDPDVSDELTEQAQVAGASEGEAEDLLKIAHGLEQLAVPPCTPEVEDRILVKIESALSEEGPAPLPARPSRLRLGLSGLAAQLPRVLIQRRADAFAMMLEDAQARRPVSARGEMAAMLRAAGALRPLPAVGPSPSFVDWLEVRLASPGIEMPPRRLPNPIPRIEAALRSGRLQAALAAAAAVLTGIAVLNLQATREGTEPIASPRGGTLAPGPPVPGEAVAAPAETAAVGGPTVPAVGVAPVRQTGSLGSGTAFRQGNGGAGRVGGGSPPPPDDGMLSTAANEGRDVLDRVEAIIGGEGQ